MIRSTIGRWVPFVVLAIILLAVWRANGGSIESVVQSIWTLLNRGADVVIAIWNAVTGALSSDASASSSAG